MRIMAIVHNPTVDTLLTRRTIRAFEDTPISEDERETLERAAQQAATSQYFNAWSAIRISDKVVAQRLAEIGNQPYIRRLHSSTFLLSMTTATFALHVRQGLRRIRLL